MAVVYFDETPLSVQEGEPVLDTLINHQIDVNYGCKSGICQSCILQAVDGPIPTEAQKGLKEEQIENGYFLACQCHPTSDIHISSEPASLPFMAGTVLKKEMLAEKVIQLSIKVDLKFKAGQFVNLKSSHGVIRSYSIASQPKDGVIDVHIKHIDDGAFSHWAKTELEKGDRLEVQGPYGDFYYSESENTSSILMAAINTGLAPIYGVLKDIISKSPEKKVELFIGAKDEQGHYLIDELNHLSAKHPNFTVTRVCLINENNNVHLQEGDIYQTIKSSIPDTKGHSVYICGAESFVKKLKKQCFLSGANMGDIHSDAFLAAQ